MAICLVEFRQGATSTRCRNFRPDCEEWIKLVKAKGPFPANENLKTKPTKMKGGGNVWHFRSAEVCGSRNDKVVTVRRFKHQK
jgi:hypothetical protein